jgi:hypothetical protein
MKKAAVESLQREAWIGDAVLELYARLKILREDGRIDAERAKAMCSNHFLAAFGEPTSVEAAIGRAFQAGELGGAFEWIDTNLMPLFARQEEKKRRGLR